MRERPQIFISYVRDDRDFASRLSKALTAQGAHVWADESVVPGAAWGEMLREAIEGVDALLLVIPERHAAYRNYVRFEAGAAKALGKPVLAVLPPNRNVYSVELPMDTAGMLVLDSDSRSIESIVEILLQAIPSSIVKTVAS